MFVEGNIHICPQRGPWRGWSRIHDLLLIPQNFSSCTKALYDRTQPRRALKPSYTRMVCMITWSPYRTVLRIVTQNCIKHCKCEQQYLLVSSWKDQLASQIRHLVKWWLLSHYKYSRRTSSHFVSRVGHWSWDLIVCSTLSRLEILCLFFFRCEVCQQYVWYRRCVSIFAYYFTLHQVYTRFIWNVFIWYSMFIYFLFFSGVDGELNFLYIFYWSNESIIILILSIAFFSGKSRGRRRR